ncbi:MAG: hypothetical protein KAJ23_11615 [Maribacter sp.]|nr:hypothetical protein [Candidatus Heimdallarchaeota archaeon]MCK5442528.1 hypothetical protein [Maribacter sp.]
MKKLFSFIAIIGIILASNCSRIPENNDAVIGIWANTSSLTNSESSKSSIRFEWIFNDAYLGRYHVLEDGNIVVETDFKWTQEDGIYTISYPGMDKADDLVSMEESEEGTVLQDAKGTILAIRE